MSNEPERVQWARLAKARREKIRQYISDGYDKAMLRRKYKFAYERSLDPVGRVSDKEG